METAAPDKHISTITAADEHAADSGSQNKSPMATAAPDKHTSTITAAEDHAADAHVKLGDQAGRPTMTHCVFPSGWQHLPLHPLHPKPPRYFDPTHLVLHVPEAQATVAWSARNHRKGRYPKVLKAPYKVQHPRLRLWGFDWWDISWWGAAIFTLGSVAWVVNAFFAMWPLSDEDQNAAALGYSALVGGTLFEIGSIVLVWDALNPEREVEFGKVLAHDSQKLISKALHRPRRAKSLQRGRRRKGTDGAEGAGRESSHTSHTSSPADPEQGKANGPAGPADGQVHGTKQPWVWWGFRWRSMGYDACFLQLIGATVFWVSCITAPPGVLGSAEDESNYRLWDGAFWAPQVAGACFFIVSAIIFMVEVQRAWWRPAITSLGWHVGFWNLAGAIGFWLSGFFGFYAVPADKYQHYGTSLSTFWGGWAFLIGSYLQLVESLNKHPA